MSQHRAVLFHFASAPYEAGDVAGFPLAHARELVDRGIAAYHPPETADAVPGEPIDDLLATMNRNQLVAFGREHLGMTDEPGADIGDDELRAAIRGSVDGQLLKVSLHASAPDTPAGGPPTGGKAGKKA